MCSDMQAPIAGLVSSSVSQCKNQVGGTLENYWPCTLELKNLYLADVSVNLAEENSCFNHKHTLILTYVSKEKLGIQMNLKAAVQNIVHAAFFRDKQKKRHHGEAVM